MPPNPKSEVSPLPSPSMSLSPSPSLIDLAPPSENNPPSENTSQIISTEAIKPQKLISPTEIYSPEMMHLYYQYLFPSSLLYQWLSPATNPSLISQREFSFTLQGDVYIRYLSFADKQQLKEALVKKLPEKIDLGAIFNQIPTQNATSSSIPLMPIMKELIFDIDMTDYNDVRQCCDESNVCEHCWLFMTVAMKVLDTILRQDFGFQHLLFIYSGRRGIHCWVCDERALKLTNDIRTAIVEYCTVYVGGRANDAQKTNLSTTASSLHPTLVRIYDLIEPMFGEIIERQRLLSAKNVASILNQFDEKLREEVRATLTPIHDEEDGINDNLDRWEQFKKLIETLKRKAATNKQVSAEYKSNLRTACQRTVFANIYPRLDVNVSKQLNHLLKSPFCVHPKTGRVCIPIDIQSADEFHPIKTPPNLQQLCEQLGRVTSGTKYWQQTDLKPHIEYFYDFVKSLQAAQTGVRALQTKERRTAINMEF